MKKPSISLRLTGWFSAISLFGFVLFGVTMWIDLAYSLSQGRDRTLTRRATRFIELLDATRRDSQSTREARLTELADAMPEGNLIQVFEATGDRLFPRNPSPADFPWPAVTGNARPEFRSFEYHGRPYRLFERGVPNSALIIVVAGQLEDNRNMMARFTTGLIWAIPAMLALSALGGYFLSRRVLQPVDQITAALRSINIGNLFQRLPISNTGDELHRLAATCNEMLARLEDAVERIHRFTADASHELRSPLALIRTVAEFTLRNPKIDADSREAFEEILAESLETGRLLEDMLTLARADAGHIDAILEPVELSELVEDLCARWRPVAETKRQLLIVATRGGPVWVDGDHSGIRRLLSILIDNAVKYTPAEGRIEVALVAAAAQAVITVTDTGMGIPEALLPRIFDRFVRADPSRGKVGGTGLGLAIAKCIAGAHHASLTVASRENEGSTFTVAFSVAAANRAPAEPGAPGIFSHSSRN